MLVLFRLCFGLLMVKCFICVCNNLWIVCIVLFFLWVLIIGSSMMVIIGGIMLLFVCSCLLIIVCFWIFLVVNFLVDVFLVMILLKLCLCVKWVGLFGWWVILMVFMKKVCWFWLKVLSEIDVGVRVICSIVGFWL